MSVKFTKYEKSLSQNDFIGIEDILGFFVPKDIRDHYLQFNGGKPIQNFFILQGIRKEIKDFLPFLYNKTFGNDPGFTLEGRAIKHWMNKEVPKFLLPFAMDYSGNYISYHLKNNRIYYFNRNGWGNDCSNDIETRFINNSVLLANCLQDFLGNLFEANFDMPDNLLSHCNKNVLEFADCQPSLVKEDFKEIEQILGIKIPRMIKTHYLKYNGGYPNNTLHDDGSEVLELYVNHFLPFKYHPYDKSKNIPQNDEFTIENIAKKLWEDRRMPTYLLPFAIDYGGNYIAYHLENRRIYFYAMDTWLDDVGIEENFVVNSTFLAKNFNKFLNALIEDPDE